MTIGAELLLSLNQEREFFLSLQKASEYIANHKGDRTPVINQLLDFNNSYELYLDDEIMYIEACPGIWELENLQLKDAIIVGKNITIYRQLERRNAKYRTCKNRVYCEIVEPFPIEFLKKRTKDFLLFKSRLEEIRKNFNPLFARIIEDKTGKLYFVGLRKTEKVNPRLEEHPRSFAIVEKIEDISDRIAKKPVLFNIGKIREEQLEFIKAARLISQIKKEVYVKSACCHIMQLFCAKWG